MWVKCCRCNRRRRRCGAAVDGRQVALKDRVTMARNIDITAAIRIVAERRIEQAMKEGKFDNLPGAGKPLELEPAPADENARLMWWALRLLRQNGFVPDEVVLRREIEGLRARLVEEADSGRRGEMARKLNELIRRLNTLGTNAMSAAKPYGPEPE